MWWCSMCATTIVFFLTQEHSATTNNFILSQANSEDIRQQQPSYKAQKQKVTVCNHWISTVASA
jgi:PP-loop superfamily ATP-utilizing enzyme